MISDAKKKANAKWDAVNMTVVGCKVKKTDADRYKAAAAAMGTTVSAICKTALEKLASDAEKEKSTE